MDAKRDLYFSPQDEDDFGEWLDQFPQPTEEELDQMHIQSSLRRDFQEES